MQRNLIPLRTWRVVCLPDNYLAVLSTGAWGSSEPDQTSSLRPDARASAIVSNIQSIQPTDGAKKLGVSSIGAAPGDRSNGLSWER